AALRAVSDAMENGKFGASGRRVVIEEFLTGEEGSFFALCDGEHAIPFGICQDHKPVFDGDRGPNTGGIGACSPLAQLPPQLEERSMREIILPTLQEMNARPMPSRGVLFTGLMVKDGAIRVIEFTARFGDPECQALMMRFEGDRGALLRVAVEG